MVQEKLLFGGKQVFIKNRFLKGKFTVISFLAILSFFITEVFAEHQEPNESKNYFDMSLDELLEVEVGVASRKVTTQRTSPGIVTVITRDEIQKSGARDLIDILRLVPGFDVGFDISGAYGVGVRGLWANEGKVLVLMDGLELNDDMYSGFQYGHHIPVDIIDRIEIMRGPGSAMYGEAAELAVISITTISPEKENDIFASTTYSSMGEILGRKGVTGFYGTKKDDMSLSAASFYERGNFTDRTSTNYDLSGNSVDLGDNGNSNVKASFSNISAAFGNLSFRAIIDRYGLNSPWPGSTMYHMGFDSDIIESKYKWALTDKLSITSRFIYKHQEPWNYPYVTYGGGGSWQISSEKYTGEVVGSYDMEGGHNIVGGISYDELRGRDDNHEGYLENGKNSVSYNNIALYGEGFFKTPYGNLTVGGRYVKHSKFDADFVPRVAFTKVMGDYHIKAMFSKAYRNPSIMNIAYNPDIKPEKTTIYELEAGAKVSDRLFLTANVFDVEIRDPVVYSYNETSLYTNFEKTGSQGVECSAIYKNDKTNINLTYSFYKAKDNKVGDYAIPGENDLLLGFPSHKLSLYVSHSPFKDFFITPTLTYYSSRYAVTDYVADYVYKKLDPKILTNISFLYKNAFKKEGLDLSFSIYNIFNEDYDFIEPYLGGYAPVPCSSRTFVMSLRYKF
jgi:outer membrane cobalamin receptor